MIASLKAEFRKLLTVRSTYFITGLVVIIASLLSFFAFGYKAESQALQNPGFTHELLYNALGLFVTFATILTILMVAHEYRYNTIAYTFTLARSRLKVLLSKIVVMLTYTTVVGIGILAIAYSMSQFGLSLKGAELVPQQLPTEIIWQFFAYAWGYILTGVSIAVLIRSLVGSVVAFFLIPTAEQILSLILKSNTKFLPFRSLEAVAATNAPVEIGANLGHAAALGIFGIYLVIFGALATWLFVHRDAN